MSAPAHQAPPAAGECKICFGDIDATNYVEYRLEDGACLPGRAQARSWGGLVSCALTPAPLTRVLRMSRLPGVCV